MEFEDNMDFENTIVEWDLGASGYSSSSECFRFGIVWGCTIHCPVLRRGECELMLDANKELYEEALEEYNDN